MWDQLLFNARLASFVGPAPYGAEERGCLAISEDRIAWCGRCDDLAGPPESLAKEVIDLEGRWVTPGLIDCHTHLVYGGDRAAEFEQRLEGVSYAEIARAGGGIRATVSATREASEEALFQQSRPRLAALAAEGVTTLEIKSGYGLALDQELKQLRVARWLEEFTGIGVRTTFLGAHALPPDWEGSADDYIENVVAMLPRVKESGLADAVDAFCESIAFSPAQIERVFAAARALGLPVKLHADQLSDLGGAALAARYGALSADHLEFTGPDGVSAMAKAGTVAVLLPGAFYTLRETQLPPLETLRKAGVPLAVASDCNPGSSPLTSLLLTLNMACTLFRMTPEEALAGVTVNAARALGLQDEIGTLEIGKRADLAVWDIERPAELCYRIGFNPIFFSMKNGKTL